jgi:MFS family permease
MKTLAFALLLLCGAQLSAIGVCRLWHVYLVAAFFGFSMGGNDTVSVKLVLETFGPQFAGTILGALAFAFALSSSMRPLIAGSIVDQTQSYSWTFLIASMALLVALITVYFLKLSVQEDPVEEVNQARLLKLNNL